MKKSILTICTANQIRSVLAQAILSREIAKHPELTGFSVDSAGTWALPNQPADVRANKIAKEMGFDISEHRSKEVNASLLENQALIIVMTHSHKEAILGEFGSVCAGRVFLLTELSGIGYDIPDPVSGNEHTVREIADEIEKLIQKSMPAIIEKIASL
jgi:protein-tyrosine phosphatase